jgi:hypothetical protein
MLIALAKQGRNAPHVGAQIVASDVHVTVSERRCGVAAPTIYKGVRRPDVQDRQHTAHRVKPTLTPGLEASVVRLRWAPDKSPAQNHQGLRAVVYVCGCAAPAEDGARGPAPVPVCGHRSGHPLGLRGREARMRRHRQALLSGVAHYRLQPAGDSFRIRQKVVTLQERDEAFDNLTFLI